MTNYRISLKKSKDYIPRMVKLNEYPTSASIGRVCVGRRRS